MPTLHTCLWYDGDALEAAKLYTSLLPESEITQIYRPDPDAPPVLVQFTLAGAPYSGLNGGPGVTHSSAASIAIELDQPEADALYDALLAAGGTEVQCGWVTDRFGVSWQIIPNGMFPVLFGEDPDVNQRAFAAMRMQKKLNVADIHRAVASQE